MGNRSWSNVKGIYIRVAVKMQLFFVKNTTFGIGATINPLFAGREKENGRPKASVGLAKPDQQCGSEVHTSTDGDRLPCANQLRVNILADVFNPNPGALAEVVLVAQYPVVDVALRENIPIGK